MSEAATGRASATDTSIHEAVPSQIPSLDGAQLGVSYAPRRVKPGGVARQTLYVLIDVALVCGGAIFIHWLRFGTPFVAHEISSVATPLPRLSLEPHYGGFLLLYAALIVLACVGQDLYRTPRGLTSITESIAVGKAVGLATAVLILFIFSSGNRDISRSVVICSGIMNVFTLSGWRYAKRTYVAHRLQRGIGAQRTLIIGANKLGYDLANCFEQNRELGYVFCGFLDSHPNGHSRVLGSVEDLRQIALAQFADEVFVTLPAEREIVKKVFVQAQNLRLNLHIVPDLYDGLGRGAPFRLVGGFPTLTIHGESIPALGLAIKRVLDVLLSTFGIVLTAPLMAAVALWIKMDSPGPVFYSAPRVGRKGRRFMCHKLRTMVDGANAVKDALRNSKNERNGPFFKIQNDPRITRSGYWLRKYSIDELPQLFNVLVGQMSLVGPRPHPVDDVERYSYEDIRRLEVKPGLTGLWQITARCDPSFETNMRLDLEYIENWSLWLDFKILAKTFPEVFRASGR
jgi:exopolysaccharide biosynthesis polyprenyl glycosylphosphotransferase